jgi:RNA polymerase sigma-70 factor (ECF subfamily)
VSAGTQVVQDAPAPTPAQLRVDFGAHLEANYRRLVAQLYAITLDPAEAHSAVQDAYSRAWRTWATVSRSPDSVGWVRRVAVRSTIRSWRRLRLRSRRPVGPGPDTPPGAVLAALRGLPAAERRCVVLHHMAGAPVKEIAAVEGVSVGTTAARLARAQKVVSDGLIGLVEFDGDLDAGLGDLEVGWDAGWQDDPVSDPFGQAAASDGYDGWTPDREDPRRPVDVEEDQR